MVLKFDKTAMFFDPILEPFFTKMVVGENVRSKYVIVILCNYDLYLWF